MGFSVNGGDSAQEGAAILVNDIHAARAELESKGVKIGNWRIDEQDGKRLQAPRYRNCRMSGPWRDIGRAGRR
jgi:hypothetical protein